MGANDNAMQVLDLAASLGIEPKFSDGPDGRYVKFTFNDAWLFNVNDGDWQLALQTLNAIRAYALANTTKNNSHTFMNS